MLSYTDLITEAQEQAQDDSAASETLLKRGINQGLHKFRQALRREYTKERKTFSTVADQQFYQMPEDAVRIDRITVTIGDIDYPLVEIDDDDDWYEINMTSSPTSDIPSYFYVRGQDEFGLYPIPSSSGSSNSELVYQARKAGIGIADYTTGTISLTNGDATVTGSSVTFTDKMVGRSLVIVDGSENAIWYKIASYTDSTHLELENVYGGDTVTGVDYRIGEVPDIPEAYHESLIDYALLRYYLRRKNRMAARDFKNIFDTALEEAKRDFGSKTMSNYVGPKRIHRGYRHIRRDLTVT